MGGSTSKSSHNPPAVAEKQRAATATKSPPPAAHSSSKPSQASPLPNHIQTPVTPSVSVSVTVPDRKSPTMANVKFAELDEISHATESPVEPMEKIDVAPAEIFTGLARHRHVHKLKQYELGRTLGSGTFAKVKIATNRKTGEVLACKIIRKSQLEEKSRKLLKQELNIMHHLRHKYIIRLHDVLSTPSRFFIFMDLAANGELFDRILDRGHFTEAQARKYFQQLIYAVEYMHENGVVHRDIKPENLLLDENMDLKVSDFGFSTLTLFDSKLLSAVGTPNYVAPEVLRSMTSHQGYDGQKADIWSCGVTLFIMLTGMFPFHHENSSVLYNMIMKKAVHFPKGFPTLARDLVSRILTKDPEERYTLAQIKQHDWFQIDCPSPPTPLEPLPAVHEVPSSSSAQPSSVAPVADEIVRKVSHEATELVVHEPVVPLLDLEPDHVLNQDVKFSTMVSEEPVSEPVGVAEVPAAAVDAAATKQDADADAHADANAKQVDVTAVRADVKQEEPVAAPTSTTVDVHEPPATSSSEPTGGPPPLPAAAPPAPVLTEQLDPQVLHQVAELYYSLGDRISKQTTFISTAPAALVAETLVQEAKALGASVVVTPTNIKLTVGQPRSHELWISIELIQLADTVLVVELDRLRGPPLDFYQFYRELIENLGEVVTISNMEMIPHPS